MIIRPQEAGLIGMTPIIKQLNRSFKRDSEYFHAWVANIAMAQMDCERWYREEHRLVGPLEYSDRLAIANNGAKHFLKLLSK